ncbi:MAG: DUF4105 domain-containing protein [Rubrivivax sp.]|nr:DUF4105 domain-containing protein [Rubrivivax sp.]
MTATLWAQSAIVTLGALHALAAYAYFSRSRGASAWALGWVVVAAVAAWSLPVAPGWTAAAFAAAIALWTLWWVSIRALPRRSWIAENERQATGEVSDEQSGEASGTMVTIHDLRDFHWRSKEDFDARWQSSARFNLEAIEAVDLFTSTWGEPRIAHLILSFVFRDGQPPVAFSIETRREAHEAWTAFAGFMKAFELIIVAARETDVIRLRTHIRGETVRRFRLRTTPTMRRKLFLRYVREMNSLAARPRFYNTLFANCTTEVARILRTTGRRLPWGWPLVVSGHVPRYFHGLSLVEPTSERFEAVERAADIGERARDEGSPLAFSQRIRS